MRSWLKPATIKTLSPTEAAWLAGMLDGEGTICRYATGRDRKSVGIIVAIYNTHKPTVDHCATITGVGAVTTKSARNGWKTSYQWRLNSQRNIVSLLQQLIPYMVTKKDKATEFISSWAEP